MGGELQFQPQLWYGMLARRVGGRETGMMMRWRLAWRRVSGFASRGYINRRRREYYEEDR